MFGIIVYMKNIFYDGTKLLSLKDINGNTPELFICTSNRTAGKTTFFNRMVVNRWIKDNSKKFCLLYRFKYELDNIPDKFFKDISTLFFQGYAMTAVTKAKGVYVELFLADKDNGKKPCGYALALNNADQIKKYSHLFSDVHSVIFDEFQSETNHYCPKEVEKFLSIHTSIARGGGSQRRYVPVYMISNPVTLLNPYYRALGISNRLQDKTKFLRGDGFILEQGHNESAEKAQKTSGINRAFADTSYTSYSTNGRYLYDLNAFIEKLSGNNRYLCTVRYDGKEYAVREYTDQGLIYCDDRPDKTDKNKICVQTVDHNTDYTLMRSSDLFISSLRYYFDRGLFRFKNLECKNAILHLLSY